MDFVKKISETLHTGADWVRAYKVTGDVNFNNARGVCKLRTLSDELIMEATCSIDDNRLIVEFKGVDTLSIDRALFRCKYDVFLITEERIIKLVMGNMSIIHDVSMH